MKPNLIKRRQFLQRFPRIPAGVLRAWIDDRHENGFVDCVFQVRPGRAGSDIWIRVQAAKEWAEGQGIKLEEEEVA